MHWSCNFPPVVQRTSPASPWICKQRLASIDIEKIQRIATKQVPGLRNNTYLERLKILKLPTLKHRRRGDLIEAFKMMNGFYDSNAVHFFNMQTSGITRGHSQKLKRPIRRTNMGQNWFTSCIVTDGKTLPEDVVNAVSMNDFKNKLDEYFDDDSSVYDYDS